jgi:hypothetical protein
MRTLCGLFVSLLVMFVIGCTAVDPDECWVNTSGGFGGGGTIPIGNGVGATSSGDFVTPPPGDPLDYGGDPNPCMAGKIVDFPPSNFPFVTTIPDDGTGPSGGWQVARANLEFIDIHNASGERFYCGLTIEMPLRNHVYGKISTSRAADICVEVTEDVAYKMDNSLPQGIFCFEFFKKVKAAFPSRYPKLGERVTQ